MLLAQIFICVIFLLYNKLPSNQKKGLIIIALLPVVYIVFVMIFGVVESNKAHTVIQPPVNTSQY